VSNLASFKINLYICAVKRFIAISFLLLYVFTAPELNQLLKLPMFVEHFIEHKTLDSKVSLIDFLYMHYTDHDIKDNDQDKDMQLPFKSHNDCAAVSFLPVLTNHVGINLNLVPVVAEKTVFYTAVNFQSSFLSSIWQPPKAC